MKMMRSLKTATKIISLSLTLLLLLILVAVTGFRVSVGINANMTELFTNNARPAALLQEARAVAIDSRRALASAFVATDPGAGERLATYIQNRQKRFDEIIADYETTNPDEHEKTTLLKVKDLAKRNSAMQNDIVALIQAGKLDAARERANAPDGMALGEEFTQTIFDLAKYLVDKASALNTESDELASSGSLSIMVLSVIAVVLGLLLSVIIARAITKPLNSLQQSINVFAGGDVTCRFDTEGKDEVADIGRSLDSMAVTLSRVIGQVTNAALSISEAAHEFSAMAEETNASVEEFRANIDEMGHAMENLSSSGEEINASVEEVAAGAQATAQRGTDIAKGVDDAMTSGDEGMTAVHSANEGINNVASNAKESTRAVQELGNNARRIQNFVVQISGIADQTNLLALNAAIEAARAGDAGRGFAVVAEEVRKLAEDSNVAARSIADLAGNITRDLDKVVEGSIQSAADSDKASGLSARTEETIKVMIDHLNEIAHSTQDLAAVSEEQAASSEEIAETVQGMASRITQASELSENIRTSVGEVAAAAERVAQGAESLSSLSGALQEELKFFKLDGKASHHEGSKIALPGRIR